MSQYPGPDMSQPDDDSTKRYGSSESESKPSGSSSQPRKRASRAGTRSVSNLSAAQLERKRANDREAQRAIRLRTKEHIESLERKVAEYTGISEQRDRVLAANQARVRELEQENAYLRSRVGNDAFLMQLPNNTRPTDSALGHSAQTSPQTKFTSEQISRPASQAARHSVSGPSSGQPSRPEAWRQQSQPGVFSPTESNVSNVSNQSRPEPSRSVSWRNPSEVSAGSSGHSLSAQNSMDQSQRPYSTPSAHERPGWSGNQGYNYIMDPSQQSGNYTASSKPAGFQGHLQSGHYPIVPPTQPQQQNYGAPLGTPSAEFSNLSMQSPANPAPSHEQSQEHAPYGVQAGHIQQGQNYQPPNQQASMPRPALAPPFNQPSTSTGYPQPGMTQTQHMPMEYQGPAGQPSYSYGQYHGNG